MDSTVKIQKRLAALGYDPGPVDGVPGPATRKAVEAFQRDRDLVPDGLVGPRTRAVLWPQADSPSAPDLPWYSAARRLIGTKEVAGRLDNPAIMNWARALGVLYFGDGVPWCGLFVAHCIAAALPAEPLPAGFLGARNWRRFGQACQPTLGCVLVFWRTHPCRSPNGHVGFHAGEDEDAFHVLGGNQSDGVNVTRIAKSRLLEARFPGTVPLPARRIVAAGRMSGALSTNEV